jgi:predicted nucleotidyltransferase
MTRQELSSRIEELKAQLVHKYSPSKIILFGSAAREGGEANDVDLFIIKDDVPFIGAERVRQLYRLIDTDLPVDYIVYRPGEVAERLSLGDPFLMEVLREGKVLHG